MDMRSVSKNVRNLRQSAGGAGGAVFSLIAGAVGLAFVGYESLYNGKFSFLVTTVLIIILSKLMEVIEQ
jgi:hypothetical protein